jgi:hypothetical protein
LEETKPFFLRQTGLCERRLVSYQAIESRRLPVDSAASLWRIERASRSPTATTDRRQATKNGLWRSPMAQERSSTAIRLGVALSESCRNRRGSASLSAPNNGRYAKTFTRRAARSMPSRRSVACDHRRDHRQPTTRELMRALRERKGCATLLFGRGLAVRSVSAFATGL